VGATREETRDDLLEAAYDVVVAGNWARARMADVAAAAGVSRQTLYNEFGTKDALAQALALREAHRFLAATESAIACAGDPVQAVATAVATTLRAAADNPLLKAVLTDDAGDLLPYLTTRAEPILAAARAGIQRDLLAHWPALDPDEVDLVAEALVRLTVSYLVLPGDLPAQVVAARTARLVERLLGG